MKNILVIGATGQIGSELTIELRKRYGDDHVVAGYIPSALPQGILKSSGPSAIADVTDRQSIEVVCRQFKIDTIYNHLGQQVENAPHPMEKLTVPCDKEIPAGSFIRKKKN